MMAASDYPAVEVFCKPCPIFREPVAKCAEIKCCWKFARHGHEQRTKDDERILAEKNAAAGKVKE